MGPQYPQGMGNRARTLPLAALACLVGLGALHLAAFQLGATRWLDGAALDGLSDFEGSRVEPLLASVAALGDPGPFALAAAALVAVALLRGDRRLALAVPAVLLAANATTQVLKPLLAEARVVTGLGADQIAAASWPSGHATASMSLALCAVLVATPGLRSWAAAGGAVFAAGVGSSVVALGWHFPSDVLAGYLVAATWTLVALAALCREPAGRPSDGWAPALARVAGPTATAGIAAAGVGAAALALRPEAGLAYARGSTAALASVLAMVALAALLAVGLALRVRR